MNSDVVSMIGNLSQSLHSVETLVSGFGYVIGILFMVTAMTKLKQIGSGSNSSQGKMFGVVVCFGVGAALIFLPTMVTVLSNTAFGSGNVLQYIQYNPYSIYNSMGIVIQTAGLIWFVRGCVLLVHGSESGAKEGPKGLTFIGAGILAMNFQYSFAILNYAMNALLSLTGLAPSGT